MEIRPAMFRSILSLLGAVTIVACSKDAADPGALGQAPAGSTQQPASTAPAGNGAVQPSAAGRSGSTGAAGQSTSVGAGGRAAGASGAVAGGSAVAGSGAGAGASSAGSLALAGTGAAAGSGGTSALAGMSGASGEATAGGPSTAPVVCPETVLAPGETTTTLQVGSVSRTFILHVPQSYTGKEPVPFVTDWHALQSTGAGQEGVSGYKALADKEGFIIAWPNGIDNAWNIGPCCTTSRTVDDLGFAKAVVENVKSRACIDPKRVYADGYSMGGGMSHYLACNAADVFAAVAPSAFDLLTEDEEPCKPARPITVIFFRGTSDPLVNYMGGASMPPSGLNVTIHFLGAEATFKKWADLDGCTDMPMDTGDGCQTYSQCQGGTEVTLCTKQGGGHDPGDATRGWETLKKHPML
jgi:polyhydroxybutyrate depolymerase